MVFMNVVGCCVGFGFGGGGGPTLVVEVAVTGDGWVAWVGVVTDCFWKLVVRWVDAVTVAAEVEADGAASGFAPSLSFSG